MQSPTEMYSNFLKPVYALFREAESRAMDAFKASGRDASNPAVSDAMKDMERWATLTAVIAYHLTEWVFSGHEAGSEATLRTNSLAKYRDELCASVPMSQGLDAFTLIEDVADAFKHYDLTRNKGDRAASDRKPRNAAELFVDAEKFGTLPWGEFRWGGSPSIQVVTDKVRDRRASLSFAIHKVVRMWDDLYQQGLV